MIDRIRHLATLHRILFAAERAFWVEAIALGSLVPLLLFVLFSASVEHADRPRLLTGSLLLAGMVTVTRYLGESMVILRNRGQAALLFAHGASRTQYLAVRCLHAVLLGAVPFAGALAATWFAPVPPPTGLAWVAALGLALACFMGIGLCVGAFARTLPTANMVLNTLLAVSVAFLPLLYPMERVPDALAPLVRPLPPTLGAELLASAWMDSALPTGAALGLVAWTAVLLPAGAWGARRSRFGHAAS